MQINKERLREFMLELTANTKHPKGNYNHFARILGIDVSRLHKILNKPEAKGGTKTLGRLKTLCEIKGRDFNYYIF